MNAIEVIIWIIVSSLFALFGYWLYRRAKKINPKSTWETARELINGMMGGAIVAIILITTETGKGNYPFLRSSLAIGFSIFIAGVAFRLGSSLNKK